MTVSRIKMKIPRKELDYYNRLLAMTEVDFEKEQISEDSTLQTYTVDFGNGIEADIKVCAGQTNLFVDPVLFHNGSEVCVLETADEVDGEYFFEYEGVTYIAEIAGE